MKTSVALTDDEKSRYTRQMMIDGWGEEGQRELKASTVFIAGAGGLGSPVSLYLAAAGVGHIVICDFDKPDLSNLNRQILHDHTRIGINKAISAQLTLERLNPFVRVTPVSEKIDENNVDALVDDARIIVDCMDNFPTRFVLNRCAARKGIPLVYGSIRGMEGRLSFMKVPETACLECLIPEAPPKEVFPVVGATPAVIGSLQALETLKFLTGTGENIKGKMLVWDGTSNEFSFYRVSRDPACPFCSHI